MKEWFRKWFMDMRWSEKKGTYIYRFALHAPAPLILLIIGGLTAVVWGGCWVDGYSCISKWQDSQYNVQWTFSGGCRIKINGDWLPEERIVFPRDNR